MQKSLCGALIIALWSAQLGAGPQTSERDLQRRIEQGGKHWSAPKSARDITYDASAGDQLWLWPLKDGELDVSRGNPRLTFGCRLRSPVAAEASTAQ